MDIDFVICWVDGNDPEWQEQKRKYQSTEMLDTDAGDCRYRDWDILKYWFRSVEKNAPWVRNIFFVTCGQVPDFLNIQHPKLKMISHKEFMPAAYLPTFSSRAIEINLCKIPELSECFVLFNDDFFVNKPIEPDIFFKDKKPCYLFMYRKMKKPDENAGANSHARYNGANVVYSHFNRKTVFKKGISKVFNKKYGLKNNVWNLYCLPRKELLDFMDPHVAVPILKSTMKEVWENEYQLLESTSLHRFRENSGINPYIFRYWDLARGNFTPANPSSKQYTISISSIEEIYNEVKNASHALICLNDTSKCDDFDACKKKIVEAFEERYPEKSAFEL